MMMMMMMMKRGYMRLKDEEDDDEQWLLKEEKEEKKNRRPGGVIGRIRSAVAGIFDAPPPAAASATASAAAVALSVSVAVLAANGAGGGGGGSGRAVRGLQNENFIAPDVPTGILIDLPTNTNVPTEVPTEVSTESPIEVPTEVPTESPIEVLIEAPTESLIEVPTEVPTESPIEIEAPTAPIEMLIEAPTESSRPPPLKSPPLKFPPMSPSMCSLRSPSPSRCPPRPPPSSPPRRLSNFPSRSPPTTPSRPPSPLDSPLTTDLLPPDVGRRRLSAWLKSGRRKTGWRILTGRSSPWRPRSTRLPMTLKMRMSVWCVLPTHFVRNIGSTTTRLCKYKNLKKILNPGIYLPINFPKVELAKSLKSRSSKSLRAFDRSIVTFSINSFKKAFCRNFTALLILNSFMPFFK